MNNSPVKPTNKRVKLFLQDGRVFSVSAHVIAHDRATYYAKKDPETTYAYEYAAVDNSELRDWLLNNMDWWDLAPRQELKHTLTPLSDAIVEDAEVVDGD